MLANHRAFPEAEKSLGHVIAQWTDEPYHKNEIVKIYRQSDEPSLWSYNAKDVHVLRLVKQAQEVYARGISGLPESVAQANNSVRPYVINSLLGFKTHSARLEAAKADAEQRALAWRRVARVLTGIKDFNPGSSTQCVDFFHKQLEYPAVARTEMGKAKLDRKALHKIAVNYPNPLIPVIIRYRKANKDASGLHANGWRMPWETKYANP
jgi:DNA polymerase I-like protein with 3'-5' exonuclease and polymerase domains